jgi:hypothetical protein
MLLQRKTRRDLEVAETIGATGGKLRGLTLDPEHELRAGQYALQCHLDAAIEIALPAALAPEIHQPLDVGIGPLAAVRATHQRRDDLPGASILRAGGGRAREDLAAARRVARTFGLEGPGDRERHEVRDPERVARVM